MLTKRIIPCLDVKDARVVKGINFINLKDAGDPVETACKYEKEGADELVFLDITASYEKRNIMLDIVKEIAKVIFMPFTVGGGIRTINDIYNMLKSGADKVSLNSAAIKNPKLVSDSAKRFGSQCIVVAIDAKQNSKGSWDVYINGGRNSADKDAVEWAKQVQDLGAGEILLTSMDCDGLKNGYDNKLNKKISETLKIPVIASGGAGNLEHLYDGLVKGKADAVLAASIFHYGKYTIKEAKKYLKERGVCVREG